MLILTISCVLRSSIFLVFSIMSVLKVNFAILLVVNANRIALTILMLFAEGTHLSVITLPGFVLHVR